MASSPPRYHPARLRSYLYRLPLATRAVLLLVVCFWLATLQSRWDVVQWGALIPDKVTLTSCPFAFPRLQTNIQTPHAFWLLIVHVYRLILDGKTSQAFSIPSKYFPSDPSQRHPRLLQHLGSCTLVGEVRD